MVVLTVQLFYYYIKIYTLYFNFLSVFYIIWITVNKQLRTYTHTYINMKINLIDCTVPAQATVRYHMIMIFFVILYRTYVTVRYAISRIRSSTFLSHLQETFNKKLKHVILRKKLKKTTKSFTVIRYKYIPMPYLSVSYSKFIFHLFSQWKK